MLFRSENTEKVLSHPQTELRIFNKPQTRPYRRMGLVLCSGTEDPLVLKDRAKELAQHIKLSY